ncbi:MAG: CrcB family protein [Balneolaceae bacterium]|nr:MAG: CrcB family protein [Balneolaceae bacterium]
MKKLLQDILWVACGGAVGASMRHGTNQFVFSFMGEKYFFIATSIENIVGSFLIGLFFTLLSRRSVKYHNVNLFLLTGVIGSYTTYSGFMIDSLILFNESIPILITYFFGQIFVGFFALITGMGVMKTYYKN